MRKKHAYLNSLECVHNSKSWIHLSTGYEQGAQDEAKTGIKFTIGKQQKTSYDFFQELDLNCLVPRLCI